MPAFLPFLPGFLQILLSGNLAPICHFPVIGPGGLQLRCSLFAILVQLLSLFIKLTVVRFKASNRLLQRQSQLQQLIQFSGPQPQSLKLCLAVPFPCSNLAGNLLDLPVNITQTPGQLQCLCQTITFSNGRQAGQGLGNFLKLLFRLIFLLARLRRLLGQGLMPGAQILNGSLPAKHRPQRLGIFQG